MAGFLFSSFLLGIAFCAPPGVITAETLRRGLNRGFKPALSVQLGSLIGDATWATLALSGLALIFENGIVRIVLGLLGSLFLSYLAFTAMRDAAKGGLPRGTTEGARGEFLSGVFLSLSNPFNIAFWLGVGSSAVFARVENPQSIHLLFFFFAFMLGAVFWAFLFAALVAWGQRYITPAFFRWVNILCSVFLAYFAVNLLWRVLQVL